MLHPGNWFRRRLTAEINSHYAPLIADVIQRLDRAIKTIQEIGAHARLRMNGHNDRISSLEMRLNVLEKRVRDANYFGGK